MGFFALLGLGPLFRRSLIDFVSLNLAVKSLQQNWIYINRNSAKTDRKFTLELNEKSSTMDLKFNSELNERLTQRL